jgi:Outer membrane protein beta-barrel domain
VIELSNSLLYGGKVGYFLPSYFNWLGVEADVYHGTPHFKQHSFSLAGAGETSTTVVEGIHLGMTTLAMRVVIRNPGRIPGEPDTRFEPGAGLWQRFEPYGALGPAVFSTHTSTKGSTSDDTGVDVSFALGSRFFLNPQLALFAEYKLDAATLQFKNMLAPGAGLQGDYTAHNLVIGISYHFHGL